MHQLHQRLLTVLALLAGVTTICEAQLGKTLVLPSVGDADNRYELLFRPFTTDQAAMSPDGRYLAYTLREEGALAVVVVAIDQPGKAVAKITAVSDEQATAMLSVHSTEKTPASIRWLRWVTDTCLVMETNRRFPFSPELTSQGQTDTSWFNCPGEVFVFDAATLKARSLVTPKDTAEWISHPAIKTNKIPRAPHIVDFDNEDPSSVVIQAEGFPRFSGTRFVERYRLNVVTGKLKSTATYTLQLGKTYLFDRQGRPRVSLPSSTLAAFPHHFEYETKALLNGWKPLSTLTGERTQRQFSMSPANFFGRRAVPLGFGLDPNVLYFASNEQLDTYGIYGLDLTKGSTTGFAAESAIYDLYEPRSGSFPDLDQGTLINNEQALGTDVPADQPTEAGDALAALGSDTTETAEALAQRESRNSPVAARVGLAGQLRPMIGRAEDSILIYDRFTHDLVGLRYSGQLEAVSWFNASLAAAQQTMEKQFSGRSVRIIDWNRDYTRYLACIRGPVDSGAYYILDSTKSKLTEFVQRAPHTDRSYLPEVSSFSFAGKNSRQISGMITFPKAARILPVPVIVLCPSNPWDRSSSEYQADLLVLANMGFAVIQTNASGTWGFGMKQRDLGNQPYDSAQIQDIGDAVDYLAKQYAIDRKKVAIMGSRHGGYLALRALQLQPERYRCAVVLDGILDVKSWIDASRWSNKASGPALVAGFFGNPDALSKSPLNDHAELVTKPVLIMSYRGEPGSPELPSYVTDKSVKLAIASHDVPCELYDLPQDYMSGLPNARSTVFRHIEEFLNASIYNYSVKMGDLRIIKE